MQKTQLETIKKFTKTLIKHSMLTLTVLIVHDCNKSELYYNSSYIPHTKMNTVNSNNDDLNA